MLYVSKKLSDDLYCVVDTDDMTETQATTMQLEECLRLGLNIYGVAWGVDARLAQDNVAVSTSGSSRYIISVTTQGSPKFEEVSGTKAISFRGIIVDTLGDTLLLISVKHMFNRKVRLRLSDFAPIGADKITTRSQLGDDARITLVLDDNFRFISSTFDNFPHEGWCLDLCDVKSQDLLCYAYMSALNNTYDYSWKRVIDFPWRKELYGRLSLILSNKSFFTLRDIPVCTSQKQAFELCQLMKSAVNALSSFRIAIAAPEPMYEHYYFEARDNKVKWYSARNDNITDAEIFEAIKLVATSKYSYSQDSMRLYLSAKYDSNVLLWVYSLLICCGLSTGKAGWIDEYTHNKLAVFCKAVNLALLQCYKDG